MPESPDAAARGLDPVAVRAALGRLARAHEPPWLHREVARRMADKLSLILAQPASIVDWWSALGAGGDLLDAAYPKARRVRVEPDAVWAARGRGRGGRWWQAWRGGDDAARLDAEPLAPGADLIWANMMLHAVVDPVALFERWHGLLAVDGFVMFSCLGPGTLRELRALYARLGWPPPTPAFVDMHDLGDMLVGAGFADPVMDQETLTLHWDSARALLAELRTLGGNTAPGRIAGLRTPRWRGRLERELDRLADPNGRLALSFEVAYGHAFKAAPRPRVGETTTVPLETMRTMVRRRPRGAGGGPVLR